MQICRVGGKTTNQDMVRQNRLVLVLETRDFKEYGVNVGMWETLGQTVDKILKIGLSQKAWEKALQKSLLSRVFLPRVLPHGRQYLLKYLQGLVLILRQKSASQ